MPIKKILAMFVFLATTTSATTIQSTDLTTNIYQALATLHMPALTQQRERESTIAQKVSLENKKQSKKNPRKITVRELGDVETLAMYYQIFALTAQAPSQKILLNATVPYDLEILSGNSPNFEQHIFGILDRTITTAGKITLQKRICYPFNDSTHLQATQNIVRTFTTNKSLTLQLTQLLNQIKKAEGELAWFFKELEEEVINYFETVYLTPSFFDDYTEYNKDPIAMEALAAWNVVQDPSMLIASIIKNIILNGIVHHFIIFPFVASKDRPKQTIPEDIFDQFKFKYNPQPAYEKFNAIHPILGKCMLAIWVVDKITFALRFKSAFTKGLEKLAIIQHIEQKLVLISSLVQACEKVADCIDNSNLAADYITLGMPAQNYGSSAQEPATAAFEAAVKPLHPSKKTLFTKGKAMAGFKLVESAKLSLVEKLKFAGLIDSHLATARLFTEHLNKPAGYCFPEFIQADRPILELVNYWHPALNPEAVVTNSIALGNGLPQTIVITGPNAGGKSTSLKAIMYTTLLAQSLGIAPAQSMAFTPFSNLDTYSNIADAEGNLSLFQTQLKRTKDLIQTIQQLNPNEFSFVIMDEIFSGTNPKEGMAGAYGVTMKLASIPNSLTMVATHFIELTHLAEHTNNATANYKVSIKREDDKIMPLYKLEPGITDQTVAIDLLAQAGFDDDILAAANTMMRKTASR